MNARLQCIACQKTFPLDEIRYTCDCGNLLSVERDAIGVGRDVFDARRAGRKPIDQSGVWRFREGVLDVDDVVTHPEGATRLYERAGIFFKHEGENPTGSFKDRGMTVAMTQAKRLGARAVACASTGNTSAFGKALREALAAGWIDRMPRLAAIQASGANPFYLGFREDFAQRHRVAAETVASAIRIGDPVSYEKAVAAIRATNGFVEQVTDAELMAAKREIDEMGIGCEPASATTLAGVKKLRAAGVIRDGERIVCVLTGHLLKDTDAIMRNVPSERTIEIDATMDAVERALTGA